MSYPVCFETVRRLKQSSPMHSIHSRSKPTKRKNDIVNESKFWKFSNTEKQFLKWIQGWEKKVFMNKQSILQVKGNCFYSCNINQMTRMETYFKSYQEKNSHVLGQDRFVWTVFANALIVQHNQNHQANSSCATKLCLFLLLWSSFYLDLSNLSQIQELLREILICTGSLKFMFSFLPGMSMTSYISNFVSEKCDENVLCEEFFHYIEEHSAPSQSETGLYQCYSRIIIYFIQNLIPLHSQRYLLNQNHSMKDCHTSLTLCSILDEHVDNQQKHTLLTLALQHRDEALVELLLQIGASTDVTVWDPVSEEFISAEQLLISSVNFLVASKCFFASLSNGLHPTILSIMNKINFVTVYGRMMMRSLLHPSSRKADNMWRGESWQKELNCEIADMWDIGYERPFPSLRHMSKIAIRNHIVLMDKKLLPEAISELPLPNMLKDYLNLILD